MPAVLGKGGLGDGGVPCQVPFGRELGEVIPVMFEHDLFEKGLGV